MIRIAVVEDDPASAGLLLQYVKRYAEGKEEEFQVNAYANGYDFLDGYRKKDYDVVFMDIEMPNLNGIETAQNLRKLDEYVSLIFVTNMAQYAINGYEVGALDFMVKPVGYVNFVMKLEKAIRAHKKYEEKYIYVPSVLGMVRIGYADIRYIESDKHYLYVHTAKEKLKMRGTMNETERTLQREGFARCSNSFLVNLDYVSKVETYDITVDGQKLPLSRVKKGTFLQKLALHLGGRIL